MNFSERLQEARKKSGYTQEELAKKCKLATGTIQQYELGKRNPKKDTVAKIADALDLGYSFTKDGEPYFYDFMDTVLIPEHAANELFNESQLESAEKSSLKKNNGETIQEKLLHNFSKVNQLGKNKIIEYSSDIVANPKYQKDKG